MTVVRDLILNTEGQTEAARHPDSTFVAGVDRLRVVEEDTFFSTDASPRTGTQMLGYSTGGSSFSEDYFEVDLSPEELAALATGDLQLTLETYALKDTAVDNDTSTFGVEFLDGTDTLLAPRAVVGPFDLDQAPYGPDIWHLMQVVEAAPPSGTTKVRLYLRTDVAGAGSSPNTFWDDVRFLSEITAEPSEPSRPWNLQTRLVFTDNS